MKKMINSFKIEGKIFEHALVKKETGPQSKNPGTPYISGTIDVAVDDAGMNVVQVHYTYVAPTTSTGKENSNFAVLSKIINEGKTWVVDGPEQATMVSVTGAIALNEFYTSDDRFVSAKVNENSFTTIVTSLSDKMDKRNHFETDIVIKGFKRVDPTDETMEPYGIIDGAIFNFKKDLLPVSFVIKSQGGMEYFEDLQPSEKNLVFTKVTGEIHNSTIVKQSVEESAFGGDIVKTTERKVKEWVVTNAIKVPYDFGEEEYITGEEFATAIQNRNVAVAEIKKRTDEYRNSRSSTPTPAASAVASFAAAPSTGGFHF